MLLGGSPLRMATPPPFTRLGHRALTRRNILPPPLAIGQPGRRRHVAPAAPARVPCPDMDLSYPPEAEEFRIVISGWLKENLPEGWGEPGFSMTPDERKAFNEAWTSKLYGGGWICAG